MHTMPAALHLYKTVYRDKSFSGRFGGPKPSNCNPNPATCAADSEALHSKVSLRGFPPGRPVGPRGKQRQILGKGCRRQTFSMYEPPCIFAGRLFFCPAFLAYPPVLQGYATKSRILSA